MKRPRKIRMMILASCHNIGGFETKLDSLVRNIDPARFDVFFFLVYPYYKAKQMPEETRRKHRAFYSWKGVQTVDLTMRRRLDVFMIFRVARIIRRCRIDVLYFFSIGAGTFLGPIAGILSGVPAIVKEVQTVLHGQYPEILRWLDRLLTRKCISVIAPSLFLRDLLVRHLRVPPRKIRIVPNAIDLKKFSGKTDTQKQRTAMGIGAHTKIVGMIANLVPIKDHPMILRAAPKILETNPDVLFLFIGEGPCRPELEKLSRELRIDRHVRFPGYRSDVEKIIKIFDVGILCSKVEIHPNALIEIMAFAKPVIAPRVGGIPEIITHGRNGLLVPQGDSDRMAEAILRLLQNPREAEQFGRDGRKTVLQHFEKRRMIHATEDLVRSAYEKTR